MVARVDVRRYRLVLDKAECDLSDRELRVLRCFHEHPGEVLSRDHLAQRGLGRRLLRHHTHTAPAHRPDPQEARRSVPIPACSGRFTESAISIAAALQGGGSSSRQKTTKWRLLPFQPPAGALLP